MTTRLTRPSDLTVTHGPSELRVERHHTAVDSAAELAADVTAGLTATVGFLVL